MQAALVRPQAIASIWESKFARLANRGNGGKGMWLKIAKGHVALAGPRAIAERIKPHVWVRGRFGSRNSLGWLMGRGNGKKNQSEVPPLWEFTKKREQDSK